MISLRPRPVVLVLALVAVSACSSAAPTAPGGADTPAGPPLAIAVQPQSVTVDAGASATLSVIATGRAPLSYQWFAGASGTASEPIAGARESDYTTSSTSESSSYWVRVSDTSGALDSETATVTVRPRAQAPPPDPAGDEEEDEEEEEEDGEPGPPADPGPDPGPPPPPPSPPPPTPPPPPPPAETNPALEDQVLVLVNQHRAAGATCGGTPFGPVPALAMDPALRVAARGHSQDMAINDYFSHTSLDGRTFDQRIWNAGYTGSLPLGENIAAGQPTPAAVVAGWMSSAGHCANIMKPGFAEIGVGYAYTATSTYGHYWTQSFGGG